MTITQTHDTGMVPEDDQAPKRRLNPLLRWQRRTTVTGAVATAVAFGPGRLAFGMLLPATREDIALSDGLAGSIVSAAFLGFAVALVTASLLTRRLGAKLPLLAGGICAAVGGALAAVAGSAGMLTAGVVVAAMSAGLCWTPFNAVARRLVRPSRRDRVLALVSTGTTLGIATLGLGALALAWSGASWRLVWWATAVAGASVALLAFLLLPPSARLRPKDTPEGRDSSARQSLRRVLRRRTWPLHGLALAFGAVSAVFTTFASGHVADTSEAGALTVGGRVFAAFGFLGVAGVGTAALEHRVGLDPALALCFGAAASGCAALALFPDVWVAVLAGSGAVGASLMVFSALLSVAALRLFPALPVTGLSALVLAMAMGSVLGPPLAGLLADAAGTGVVLGAAAAVAAAAIPAILSSGSGAAPTRGA